MDELSSSSSSSSGGRTQRAVVAWSCEALSSSSCPNSALILCSLTLSLAFALLCAHQILVSAAVAAPLSLPASLLFTLVPLIPCLLLLFFFVFVLFLFTSVLKFLSMEPAPASLKDQGNACFKAGNYLKAAALYTQAIKLDPENPALYRLSSNSQHLSIRHPRCCTF